MDKSEEHELFSNVSDDLIGGDLEDVEAYGFTKGSAFSNKNDVSFFNVEGGRAVSGDVSVSFFISVVLGDIV